MDSNRFLIRYIHGKCERQVTSKNTIGATPTTIASYLNLENPQRYNGHSFRELILLFFLMRV